MEMQQFMFELARDVAIGPGDRGCPDNPIDLAAVNMERLVQAMMIVSGHDPRILDGVGVACFPEGVWAATPLFAPKRFQ